jgi:hypothetical protein
MAGDENTIAQAYSNYVQAFQTLDRCAVLPYCHVPYMFVSRQGVRVMATPSEVESLFNTQQYCLIGKPEKMVWLARAFLEAETV